jgi:hypothetical protein
MNLRGELTSGGKDEGSGIHTTTTVRGCRRTTRFDHGHDDWEKKPSSFSELGAKVKERVGKQIQTNFVIQKSH